jgi:hypothetical protein
MDNGVNGKVNTSSKTKTVTIERNFPGRLLNFRLEEPQFTVRIYLVDRAFIQFRPFNKPTSLHWSKK